MTCKSLSHLTTQLRLLAMAFAIALVASGCGGSSSSSGGNGDGSMPPSQPISGCDTIPSSLTSDQAGFIQAACGTTTKQFAKYDGNTKKSGKLIVGTTSSTWSISVKTGWGSTTTLTSKNAVIDSVTFLSTSGVEMGEILVTSNISDEKIKIRLVSGAGADAVARDANCKDYFTAQQSLKFSDSDSPNCTVATVSGDISNLFFFKGDDGIFGEELWKTDGTKSGTEMVRDLIPGNQGSSPYGFLRDDKKGVVYFGAGDSDRQVWQTDGTEAGTGKIASFDKWDTAEAVFTVLNENLYLTARYEEAGDTKTGLFVTDGTDSGTSRLTNTNLESAGSNPGFSGIINEKIVFSGADPDDSDGWIVWITDGTEMGTKPLTLEQGSSQLTIGVDAMFGHSQLYKGKLYFGAALPNLTDPSEWDEVLIKTDGTSQGTERITVRAEHLSNTPPGGQSFAVANDKLFFSARPDATGVYMLSYDVIDGVTKTPEYSGNGALQKVTSIATPTAYDGRVYFYGKQTDYGSELFSWNGNAANDDLELVKDINSGNGDADPGSYGKVVFNNALFFVADKNKNQELALWKTDGTESGTVEVKQPDPEAYLGYLSSNVSLNRTREINGQLLFFAKGTSGCELWITNGESSGTEMLKDIYPGPEDGTPNQC